MEKIGFPAAASFHLNSEKKGKSKKGKTLKSSKSFTRTLEDSKESIQNSSLSSMAMGEHEKLEEILDELYEIGELIKNEQSTANLKKYRQTIKHFFKYVVKNGIEAEKISGIRNPRTMEQKQYTLVKVVDSKLEKLATYILSSQKNQIEIIRGVDEIYGLLVNFTS